MTECIIKKMEKELVDDMRDLPKYIEISIKDLWNRKEEDIWIEYKKLK